MSKSKSVPDKRKNKKRRPIKKSAARQPKTMSDGPSTVKKAVTSGGGGGGVMQGMRSGFKRAAGVGDDTPSKKPSTASNVVWTLLLLAAVGFLIYRLSN